MSTRLAASESLGCSRVLRRALFRWEWCPGYTPLYISLVAVLLDYELSADAETFFSRML